MALKRKLKKINKFLGVFYLCLTILMLISSIILSVNVSYLTGIETFLRIIILVMIYLSWGIYLIYGFIWLFDNKKIKIIIVSVLIVALISVNLIASLYINKTYVTIKNITKNDVTYTTHLVTLKDKTLINEEKTIIGMISDEEDISGYILAHELLAKEKLDKVTVEFHDDFKELIGLLFEDKLSAIFLPGNYQSIFSEDDNFSYSSSDIKILYTHSKTMKKANNNVAKKDINEPFTILLLGTDSPYSLNDNADAIMMITFNPNTLSSTFLSIPRDTYVPITCRNNQEYKINKATYYSGKCMMDTVSNLTDITVDYYVKMNFTGLVDLVDELGGIEVNVPYKFCEQNSKREWGNNTIYVNAGNQKLNGEQALALTRNRKAGKECGVEWNQGTRNDFVRGQNQQLVLQAILNKFKKIRNIDEFLRLLNIISQNMDTNMTTETILSFYNVGKSVLMGQNDVLKIQRLYLQTTNLMIAGAGSTEQYQKKSLTAITHAMKINLEIEQPVLIKTFSFDYNEPFEEVLIGKGLYDGTTRKTLPNFIGKKKGDVDIFANNNNINVSYEIIGLSHPLYKDTYEDNTVVFQSVKADTLLDKVSSLTIGVISR